MAESRKPVFAWNPRNKRFEWWVSDKTQPIAYIDGNGLTVNKGSLSYSSLTVGTLTTTRTLNVTTVGSIAQVRATNLILGGGTISLITKVTGTIVLAAVGTNAVAVATVTGLGSAAIAVGDMVTVTPRAAITGVLLGLGWIPTTNVVIVPVCNPSGVGGGSLPAVGVDVLITRHSG